jgi:hypothetical protein
VARAKRHVEEHAERLAEIGFDIVRSGPQRTVKSYPGCSMVPTRAWPAMCSAIW